MSKRLVISTLFAVWSLFGQGSGSDDKLYDQVRLKLASDQLVGRGNVEVEVKDGSVKLKGKVHNDKQKQRAGKLAAKVKGVKEVMNELRVEP